MTTLTGLKDAEYMAQFLGKKIAVKSSKYPKRYYLYPMLYSINADREAQVLDTDDNLHVFQWDDLENPYILLIQDVEVILK